MKCSPLYSVITWAHQLRHRGRRKGIKACRYWPASHTDSKEERNARSIPVVVNPGTLHNSTIVLRWMGKSFARNHPTENDVVAILPLSTGSRRSATAAPVDSRFTDVMKGPGLGCLWPDTLRSCAVIKPVRIHTDKRRRSKTSNRGLISSVE